MINNLDTLVASGEQQGITLSSVEDIEGVYIGQENFLDMILMNKISRSTSEIDPTTLNIFLCMQDLINYEQVLRIQDSPVPVTVLIPDKSLRDQYGVEWRIEDEEAVACTYALLSNVEKVIITQREHMPFVSLNKVVNRLEEIPRSTLDINLHPDYLTGIDSRIITIEDLENYSNLRNMVDTKIAQLNLNPTDITLATGTYDITHVNHMGFIGILGRMNPNSVRIVSLDTNEETKRRKSSNRPWQDYIVRARTILSMGLADIIIPDINKNLNLLEMLKPSLFLMSFSTSQQHPLRDRFSEIQLVQQHGGVTLAMQPSRFQISTSAIFKKMGVE